MDDTAYLSIYLSIYLSSVALSVLSGAHQSLGRQDHLGANSSYLKFWHGGFDTDLSIRSEIHLLLKAKAVMSGHVFILASISKH